MRTTNGLKYSIKKSILTLEIPKDMGVYSKCVQDAKIELCLNEQTDRKRLCYVSAGLTGLSNHYAETGR